MAMNINRTCIAFVLSAMAVTTISGCTANDTTFGGAVRHNYAAQVVNPDPIYEDEQTMDGSKAGAAVERYRTDRVKEPVGVKTTSGPGGSGGGNGGNDPN